MIDWGYYTWGEGEGQAGLKTEAVINLFPIKW